MQPPGVYGNNDTNGILLLWCPWIPPVENMDALFMFQPGLMFTVSTGMVTLKPRI